ncbi:MAG: FimB/Mfa2 family fimbrial subunit [Prevotella sp.]|nr:FimB/Mfa2 family fimbrial subunit [Prevotella sp.]
MTGALALAGCSVIDDNLDDCGTDYQLDYELRLVTNLTTELQTALTAQTDVSVASALRTHLADIFTDHAHDVDLSFYDTQGDSLRLQHDQHIMDANQASYTLFLPMRQYMHLAVANVIDNPLVSIANDERCHTTELHQIPADTIDSHTTGLFTARLPMEVLEGVNQQFNVHLYMANCAAALVVDTVGSGISDMWVYTTGFASGFDIADSVFTYADTPPVVRAEAVSTEPTGQQVFCSVNFPSRDVRSTRTIIETTDPFIAPSADESLWQYIVCVELPDGSITRTSLFLNTPLRAGQFHVLKARAHTDGAVRTADPTVGVSVTTNWNHGGQYNPEL